MDKDIKLYQIVGETGYKDLVIELGKTNIQQPKGENQIFWVHILLIMPYTIIDM